MAIKYEIHYLPNAGGNEETRRFAHIFEQPAMTDKQMIERIAQHSCLGKGEVATVFMQLRDIIEETCRMESVSTSRKSDTSHSR